ncbi:indole-3-glycerol phosphate synthase [Cryobacterium roopkundense]|uniref:indole-3-glycerol-phosphate synthase n=1 Tax=Cryobacterium roopkundense TaxID=1001240 RepID=A0A099JTM6_9MICO|nr:indole-3-glycerol phosphate synthase [Cryobacterium roopkundense]
MVGSAHSPFIAAVLRSETPLIMEVKRRSATGADLTGGRSPSELVRLFEAADAPCISVVSGRWFGGDAALVDEVVRTTSRPVLQKDFFMRREQLVAAHRAGVSAVLLTAQLLHRDSLKALVNHALDLGLTPFVEVVTLQEIHDVPRAESCVIAVNNRDIRNKEQGPSNLDRSHDLFGAVRDTGTPLPVSASGIDSAEAAAALLAVGYRGLLVGTALLAGEGLHGRWGSAVTGARGNAS